MAVKRLLSLDVLDVEALRLVDPEVPAHFLERLQLLQAELVPQDICHRSNYYYKLICVF